MIQEFQIRVLPEQAANEQSLKQFIGHDKGLDIRTIHALRILKRSIDARQTHHLCKFESTPIY